MDPFDAPVPKALQDASSDAADEEPPSAPIPPAPELLEAPDPAVIRAATPAPAPTATAPPVPREASDAPPASDAADAEPAPSDDSGLDEDFDAPGWHDGPAEPTAVLPADDVPLPAVPESFVDALPVTPVMGDAEETWHDQLSAQPEHFKAAMQHYLRAGAPARVPDLWLGVLLGVLAGGAVLGLVGLVYLLLRPADVPPTGAVPAQPPPLAAPAAPTPTSDPPATAPAEPAPPEAGRSPSSEAPAPSDAAPSAAGAEAAPADPIAPAAAPAPSKPAAAPRKRTARAAPKPAAAPAPDASEVPWGAQAAPAPAPTSGASPWDSPAGGP